MREDKNVVLGGDVKTTWEDGWLYLTVTSNERKKHLEVHKLEVHELEVHKIDIM